MAHEHFVHLAYKIRDGDVRNLSIEHYRGKTLENSIEVDFPIIQAAPLKTDLVWLFEEYPLRPWLTPSSILTRIERELVDYGEVLFKAVFAITRQVAELWREIKPYLASTTICVQSPANDIDIPWELMCEPMEGPLAIRSKAFLRSSQVFPETVATPLRLLLVTARPFKNRDVPYRVISTPILKTLGKGPHIHVASTGSFEEMLQLLQRAKIEGRPFSMLHFDGHGCVLKDRGYLLFEGISSDFRHIDGAELGHALIATDCRTASLNACRSAFLPAIIGGTTQESFASVSGEMHRAGINSVVAMGYNITVDAARIFYRQFYSKIIAGMNVPEAVASARRELHDHRQRDSLKLSDWIIPRVWEQRRTHFSLPLDFIVEQNGGIDDVILADSVISELDRALRQDRLVALLGFTGNGKSTTAKAYTNWFLLKNPDTEVAVHEISIPVQCVDFDWTDLINEIRSAILKNQSAQRIVFVVDDAPPTLTESLRQCIISELTAHDDASCICLFSTQPMVPKLAAVSAAISDDEIANLFSLMDRNSIARDFQETIARAADGNALAFRSLLSFAKSRDFKSPFIFTREWHLGHAKLSAPESERADILTHLRLETLPSHLVPLGMIRNRTTVRAFHAFCKHLREQTADAAYETESVASELQRIGLAFVTSPYESDQVIFLHPVFPALGAWPPGLEEPARRAFVFCWTSVAASLYEEIKDDRRQSTKATALELPNILLATQLAEICSLWEHAAALVDIADQLYFSQTDSPEWRAIFESLERQCQGEDLAKGILRRTLERLASHRKIDSGKLVTTFQVTHSEGSKTGALQDAISEAQRLASLRSPEAVPALERARKLALRLGEQEEAATCSLYLGHAHKNITRDFEKSVAFYEDCRKAMGRTHILYAKATMGLGLTSHEIYKRDYFAGKAVKQTLQDAIELLQISVELAGPNDHLSLGKRHIGLAHAFGDLGDLEQARVHFEAAIENLSRAQAFDMLTQAYCDYCSILLDWGKKDTARDYLTAWIRLCREHGLKDEENKATEMLDRFFQKS